MLDDWDLERYRGRAKEWRERAASALTDDDRADFLAIAEGYAALVALLEGAQSLTPMAAYPRPDEAAVISTQPTAGQ